MGFLDDASMQLSVTLEINDQPKLVRPALPSPQPIWLHKIPSVSTTGADGKPVIIRKFKYEACTSTGRGNAGCFLCHTQDPMWNKVEATNQTNRKGQRTDFPKTCRFIMPVFDHLLSAIKVMEGGAQLYENMDKWHDMQSGPQKDLRRCDWQVWKTGTGMKTKYESQRMDASLFQFTEAQIAEAKAALADHLVGYKPTAPDKLQLIITGQTEMGGLVPELPPPAANPGLLVSGSSMSSGLTTLASPQAVAVSTPTVSVVAMATPSAVSMPVTVLASGVCASKSEIDTFSRWVDQQKEFSGMGIVEIMLPTMERTVGHVEYSKMSSQQLVDLKLALEGELQTLRHADVPY